MSAVNSIFHIVINIHRREMTIPDETSEHLYRYIWSIINLVRDIKQGSSKWAKRQVYFPMFRGWGKEYGAFSCSVRDKDRIINYIHRGNRVERILTPNGFMASDTLFAYIKDHQCNVRAVIDRTGRVMEVNHYYPYGMLMTMPAMMNELPPNDYQPYKYGTKELNRENGLDLYDSYARWYDPTLPGTTTQDPYSERYYPISPYTWCAANPVRYIDKVGKDICVSGDIESFLTSINAVSNVSYSNNGGRILPNGGRIKNMADLLIAYAAFSDEFKINIDAGNSPVLGGEFKGSKLNLNEERVMVVAGQVLNLDILQYIEDVYGMQRGVAVFHELLEAVIGTIEYPGAEKPKQSQDEKGDIVSVSEAYNNSHNRAKDLDQRFVEPLPEFDPETNMINFLPYENDGQ